MKLELWNPTKEINDLTNFVRSMLDEEDRKWLSGSYSYNQGMKVDIYEKDNSVVIEAELPGYKKEDIELVLENGYLTITAKHEESDEEKDRRYYYKERRKSVVSRTFEVGEGITDEDISAKYENGILYVTLKKPEIKRNEMKKIEIK
jgi:HSP20 family molecular chaperone IbpA